MNETRKYIRVTGEIAAGEGTIIESGRTVVFLGEPNAVLVGQASGGGSGLPTLRISGSAKVEIHQLALRESREAVIEVTQGTLLLQKSQISGADKEGVKIDNGDARVEIRESEIISGGTDSMNTSFYAGIQLTDGELTVARSRIQGNEGGGVAINSGKKFSITSSFIVENRGNGGISAPSPAPGSQLEFNTIADNQDQGTQFADAGGVYCGLDTFVAPNNIIYRNTGGSGGFVQTVGGCMYGNSLVSPNAAETRILGFVKDTMPRDYHLTSSSSVLVKNVASCVAATGFVDYDGEPRPQGGSCELGADEIKEQ